MSSFTCENMSILRDKVTSVCVGALQSLNTSEKKCGAEKYGVVEIQHLLPRSQGTADRLIVENYLMLIHSLISLFILVPICDPLCLSFFAFVTKTYLLFNVLFSYASFLFKWQIQSVGLGVKSVQSNDILLSYYS